MKGPRAIGKRDTEAIRRDAEVAGVDTARKQIARHGATTALEAGRCRSRLAAEAETASREAERATHAVSQRQEAGVADMEQWRKAAEQHHRTATEVEVATTLRLALEAAAAEDRLRKRQGAQELMQELKHRAAAAEAEHVAALTRGAIAVLMRDTVTWAQSQPAWANGHACNADGAGAAMERHRTVTPTRFHTSGRPMDFIGRLVAPGEEGGKGHMETSLQLEPTVAARAARLPRGLRPPDPAASGTDKCVAWKEEGQMWWPGAGAAAGEANKTGAAQTGAPRSSKHGGRKSGGTISDQARQRTERSRLRALERQVEAAECRRRENDRQQQAEQGAGRKQGPPATGEAQTAPDGTSTTAEDTGAPGPEGQQGRLQQHVQDRLNSGDGRGSWARQAAHAALAGEEDEQELTDAQQADEETELAEAMEEETRLEAGRDEQRRAAQELQLEMEEMEATEMTQEVTSMQQQAQEQEEAERAAALAERITEQQKAVTQARRAVAEAREEAKERLRQLGTPQRAAREEARRTSADAKYSGVQYWEDMSPQLREAIARSAALRIGYDIAQMNRRPLRC